MKFVSSNTLLAFILSLFFIAFLAYGLSSHQYIFLTIPALISLIILPIINFKILFYFVIFLTPLSISLSELGLSFSNINLAFPTEPILFGLMLLTIFQILHNFSLFKPILRHPITMIILAYLFWMFITCITSTIPLVSFKMLLTRLWYIFPIFLMGALILKNTKSISYFVLCYTVPLLFVVVYTIIKHSSYFFSKASAHYMMSPFFNDHTSYGAVLAFFLPFSIALFYLNHRHFLFRFLALLCMCILILGLILSFTRAAWISLVIATIIATFIAFKINRKILFIVPIICLIFGIIFANPILETLSKNKQDSSDNLLEHVTSISNISTDASNMERINRWQCAFAMFIEKPFFGWGPGTYQFHYAPFQLSRDRTIISSNFGDMGNAHSEYFGTLSESGFFGLISFLFLVLVVVFRAIHLYYISNDKEVQVWLLAIIISLLSYFIHGLFNNFLDTDKASVAVWGAMAMIVALDLSIQKNNYSDC